VLLVYGFGAAVLLVRVGLGIRHARMLVRESDVVAGRLTNPRCSTPVTVGLRAPVIVLPAAWVRWSDAELAAVLTHEEEHVRRRDPLAAFVTLLARAVFWFHPLAWWLQRRVAMLSEQACDAAVLAHGHDADSYATSLLRLARAQATAGGRVAFPGSAMPGSGLRHRLRLLESSPIGRTTVLQRFCAGALYAAVVLVCGAATPTASSRPAPPAAQDVSAPGLTQRWQTASSEHFEIYYERELANRVRDLTWEAERAYTHLTSALKHDLAQRVPIIFIARSGDIEDGAALALTGGASALQRIVISVDYLDARPGAMIHELTHQFAFEIIPDTSRAAPWLIEGLAEYQRGTWDSESVRGVRDAVAGAWVPDLDGLASADGYWSHALFDFIAEAHGSEGVRRYLFALRTRSQVMDAIPAAFGGSTAEFNRAFRAYVTQRFAER
jgi:BlaR1 peptidase M56